MGDFSRAKTDGRNKMIKKKDKVENIQPGVGSTLNNCNFESNIEVIWDKSVLETIDKVAEGLVNLTKLFIAQKIEIKALLHIGKEE